MAVHSGPLGGDFAVDLYELALFEADEAGGIRLVGRTTDPDLIESVLIELARARGLPAVSPDSDDCERSRS